MGRFFKISAGVVVGGILGASESPFAALFLAVIAGWVVAAATRAKPDRPIGAPVEFPLESGSTTRTADHDSAAFTRAFLRDALADGVIDNETFRALMDALTARVGKPVGVAKPVTRPEPVLADLGQIVAEIGEITRQLESLPPGSEEWQRLYDRRDELRRAATVQGILKERPPGVEEPPPVRRPPRPAAAPTPAPRPLAELPDVEPAPPRGPTLGEQMMVR